VADNEDHFREAMKKQLMSRGYHVVDVKTGAEAIAACADYLPEVMIIDQKMGDIKGVKAVREIKKKHPGIRIIVLSGYGDKTQPRRVKDQLIFRNLYKPCGIKELIDTIEAARRERSGESACHEIQQGVIRRFLGWVMELASKIRSFSL
jgi:DNA-binding NtrC family response regulator